MPSGYMQRYKGKIQATRIDVGTDGLRQYTVQSSASLATSTNFLQNAGLSVIVGSSGSAVFTLEAPVQGVEKQIVLSTVSSGAIVASTAATFDGASLAIKFLSSVGSGAAGAGISLIGLSTARWGVVGIYPSTVVVALSATT